MPQKISDMNFRYTVRSSVIGTVEKRGCLEAKGWMYKKSMFNQFSIQYFIVILV